LDILVVEFLKLGSRASVTVGRDYKTGIVAVSKTVRNRSRNREQAKYNRVSNACASEIGTSENNKQSDKPEQALEIYNSTTEPVFGTQEVSHLLYFFVKLKLNHLIVGENCGSNERSGYLRTSAAVGAADGFFSSPNKKSNGYSRLQPPPSAAVMCSVHLVGQTTSQQYYSLILNQHQPPTTNQSKSIILS